MFNLFIYHYTYIQLISYLDSLEIQKQKKGPSPTQRNKKVRSMAASLLCSNRILVLHNNHLTPRGENPLYPRSFLSQAKRNPRRGKFCVVALTESSKESSNKKKVKSLHGLGQIRMSLLLGLRMKVHPNSNSNRDLRSPSIFTYLPQQSLQLLL